MDAREYLSLKEHYEACLAQHGDTSRGVDWPSPESAATTYRVMLELLRDDKRGIVSLLDFGCGASHLYEYMLGHDMGHITYAGIDISSTFIDLSRRKFPTNRYYCLDALEQPDDLPEADYILMNGVFTEKLQLSFDVMLSFFQTLLVTVFDKARVGLAFNVMSKQVDWERSDLFHLPMDTVATIVSTHLSRRFIIRHDYGLYQYTVYVYR